MASTNQSPQYKKAEVQFFLAKTNEEKLKCLEEMIKECPKHKSSEKMLANLKTRHIKLKEKIESTRKTSKGAKKPGIKKEEMQAVIVGFANTGKSTLLANLTNTKPEIAHYGFTTKQPIQGIMHYAGTNIQIMENPAVGSEYYDKGLVNSADTLLFLITELSQIPEIEKQTERAYGKRIILFNKIDSLSANEIRKISSTLQSKKYDFVMISGETKENYDELQEKIFKSFDKIRVYLKEPGKEVNKIRDKPVILEPDSTVRDVAEKILKGFSEKVSETKIWGPSSKFAGQKVGLKHLLKDLDVVEFKTR